MSLLDTYRNNVQKKREELAGLSKDLAKEQAKIPTLQKKINSANDAIKRTKIQSTMKSKMREIESANKSIADVQKKCSDIQQKIAKKDKELADAEKRYRNEEEKVNKKHVETEKKRQKEVAEYAKEIEKSIARHEQIQSQMQMDIEKLRAIPNNITVLFLASNPKDTDQLRLDEEVRSIQEKIRLSEYRDSIRFESRWAVRSSDILQIINETNPTIVHFSGHGTENGELVLLNSDGAKKLVKKEAITMAMSTASDSIRLVVFNTCFSEGQAQSVVEHIEAAIGMSASIADDTACIFAAQLYSSIGFGKTLHDSFKQAIAELMLEGISGEDVPRIYSRDDVELSELILVQPNT